MKKVEIHGDRHTKLYSVWTAMKQRCFNPNNKRYERYGGRGITICQEWVESYLSFKKWALENGYKEGLSIDRKDNDGNYEPSNCRWATNIVQQNNQMNTHHVKYRGQIKTIREWAEGIEMQPFTLYYRLFVAKWDPEVAFTKPVKCVNKAKALRQIGDQK